ncbi:IS66 family insertion sequence element accessory protein TnpB, partial [Escherichia coli]|nr:IS66 family insertion sequence element accessory protein TnpB [Escherichia coli]
MGSNDELSTTLDITGFRTYFPDALRLRFDEQLSVRA